MEEIMPRPYSNEFVLGLHHADDSKDGVKLAKLCLKVKLPIKYVADGFDVSSRTIHSWFRGSLIRKNNVEKIQRFTALIEQGLADGRLPAVNLADAKNFIDSEVRPLL